jgi:urease accessory protein
VRYLADHVLDDMVRQLGLTVLHDDEPFEPEAGAYGGHSHSHGTHKHGDGQHQHSHDEHRVIFGGIRTHSHE